MTNTQALLFGLLIIIVIIIVILILLWRSRVNSQKKGDKRDNKSSDENSNSDNNNQKSNSNKNNEKSNSNENNNKSSNSSGNKNNNSGGNKNNNSGGIKVFTPPVSDNTGNADNNTASNNSASNASNANVGDSNLVTLANGNLTSADAPLGQNRPTFIRLNPSLESSVQSQSVTTSATKNNKSNTSKNVGSKTSTPQPTSYTFSQIATAYGVGNVAGVQGSTLAGAGAVIAIVDAYSNPNIKADLITALTSSYGILYGKTNATTLANTIANNLTVVSVNSSGQAVSSVPGNTGWGAEEALDVQTIMSLCPGAKVYLVQANSASTNDLTMAVQYAVQTLKAQVVSMSWGGGYPCTSGETLAGAFSCLADQLFANYPNVIFAAAAGDSGDGSSKCNGANVGWPMAHPDVVGVGGTYIASVSTANGGTAVQYPWADSGGGPSNYYYCNSYQQQAYTHTTMRQTPDVGFLADPYSGVKIVDTYGSGNSGTYGGTSLACPIFASLVGLANSARIKNSKAPLTQAQIWKAIYGVKGTTPYSFKGLDAATNTTFFQQITNGNGTEVGSNGCTSYPGNYDYITGMGSSNNAFYSYLLTL